MTVFLVLSVAFSILISSPVSHWAVAQMQNTTLPQNTNNTKQIVNLKDRTITLVNTTTNETISVKPIPETTGNMTANKTLSGTAANMTANDNLTEKFSELGK